MAKWSLSWMMEDRENEGDLVMAAAFARPERDYLQLYGALWAWADLPNLNSGALSAIAFAVND